MEISELQQANVCHGIQIMVGFEKVPGHNFFKRFIHSYGLCT